MLKPNNFGRYVKSEILNDGYRILDKYEESLHTATEIKEMLGIKLTHEQRLAHCKGFVCKKAWRGCVPVFDVQDMINKMKNGQL